MQAHKAGTKVSHNRSAAVVWGLTLAMGYLQGGIKVEILRPMNYLISLHAAEVVGVFIPVQTHIKFSENETTDKLAVQLAPEGPETFAA